MARELRPGGKRSCGSGSGIGRAPTVSPAAAAAAAGAATPFKSHLPHRASVRTRRVHSIHATTSVTLVARTNGLPAPRLQRRMSFELALSPASPELRSKVTSGTCPGRPSASPRALRARPAYTAPVRLAYVARGRVRRRLRRGRRLHTGLACAHRPGGLSRDH
eukprot:366476-Chlamydomonas_euryale.AAC.16